MPQGKALDLRERQLLVRLKEFFDQERFEGPLVSTKDPTGRVASVLGVSKRTVKEVLRTYHETGGVVAPVLDDRGKPPYRIQPALETVIRRQVRELNRQGRHVSVRSLSHWLAESYEEIPAATLGRALVRLGFIYGKSLTKSALRERDEVVVARREYLRNKLANRDSLGRTARPEVYLDESYVNVNHSNSRTWYFAEEGPWVRKPSGKGPRLIIVDAITSDGWVPGARLVFQAKRRTGDYHGQMNYDNFRRWFTNSLLPNIPASSLIMMDNAPYHNVYVEDAFYPTSSTKKAELARWLQDHAPSAFDESMIKAELLVACRERCPKPDYAIDYIAEAEGHRILRTPQYHPELQPIEECWGVVKNHCALQCNFTIAGLREHLIEGFDKVTAETCHAAIKDAYSEEERYWKEDTDDENEVTDAETGNSCQHC
jgi:transposase